MRGYMLDTDVALYTIARHPGLRERLRRSHGALSISALVHSQLVQGLASRPLTSSTVARFVALVPVVAYDHAASDAYGQIVATRGFSRRRILDRMIAAHAISQGAVLVTNNVRDFAEIPGLSVENWAS